MTESVSAEELEEVKGVAGFELALLLPGVTGVTATGDLAADPLFWLFPLILPPTLLLLETHLLGGLTGLLDFILIYSISLRSNSKYS